MLIPYLHIAFIIIAVKHHSMKGSLSFRTCTPGSDQLNYIASLYGIQRYRPETVMRVFKMDIVHISKSGSVVIGLGIYTGESTHRIIQSSIESTIHRFHMGIHSIKSRIVPILNRIPKLSLKFFQLISIYQGSIRSPLCKGSKTDSRIFCLIQSLLPQFA